jgi:hypothetical protein
MHQRTAPSFLGPNSTPLQSRSQFQRRPLLQKYERACHSTSPTSISTYSNQNLRLALRRMPKLGWFTDNDPAFASTDYIFFFQRVK